MEVFHIFLYVLQILDFEINDIVILMTLAISPEPYPHKSSGQHNKLRQENHIKTFFINPNG